MTQKNHVFSLIQKLPLVFLLVVIVWNWYVVIGELCIADLIVENSNIALPVSYICIFALLMTVSIISLLLTIFTSPGNPPSQQQQQQCADNSSTDQFAVVESNSMRCPYCSNIKPERCHHCSMCKRCILRMDHHCPWVNNCIGFFNYKFFYLFLFYSSVTLAFIIGITISRLAMLTTISSRIGIVYVVNLAMDSLFFISAFGLFLYHSHLILTNSTTIESTEYGKERRKIVLMSQGYENELVRSGVNVYNVGKINNVKQVLGDNAWFWFLPVKSTISGDGMTFPKKSSVQAV